MKTIFFKITIGLVFLSSCKKAQIVRTTTIGIQAPWTDTSSSHPKNAAFTDCLKNIEKKACQAFHYL